VAAIFILLSGAAITFLLLHKRSAQNTPIAFLTITSRTGEKKNITMDDGSLLTLDAGTTIRIQKDISKTRTVEVVDGQVFFDVKKDEQRPFIIHSEGLTTTVLGTSFTISNYKGLHNLSIGVISGKVSVEHGSANVGTLEKDQELVYNKTSQSYKKIPLEESLTAWQDRRLLLNDLSFYEMAVVMEKNFGVNIETTEDPVIHTKYTTELLISMTPMEAVQVLAAIHHLKITAKDNKIFLNK
jgi:ferric-dicitrate binding protein FerR (iron transport regulator)